MERTEVQLRVQTADGPKVVTVLSHVTVDDLVRVGLKAYVHEVRRGVPYESPFPREIREALTLVSVARRV